MGQLVISSWYAAFCRSQSPPLTWQNGQKWLRSLNSIERMNLRDFLSVSVSVLITMPLLTGRVHDAIGTRKPCTSTMHRRQPPKGVSSFCAHRVGISIPAFLAAERTVVP